MTEEEEKNVRAMLASADATIAHYKELWLLAHDSMEHGRKARYWLAVATFLFGWMLGFWGFLFRS